MNSRSQLSVFPILIAVLLNSAFADAQVPYEVNAFIKEWLILGPFPNCAGCSATSYCHDERCTGFYTDYLASMGGELNAVPSEGMKVALPGKDLERTWTSHHSTEDTIHLSDMLTPKDMVVAYAFSQIVSSEDRTTILSVGSNDGIRIFLNGKEIHESHDYFGRWLQSDNDYIPVNLIKGTNNLLLKIDQGTGDFGYVARFLDYDTVIERIRNSIDSYKTLKAVALEETLVASFGTRFKISVLNPKGNVTIELLHEKQGALGERTVVPGEDAKFPLSDVPEGFLNLKATFPTPDDGVITSETRYYKGKLKRHPRVERLAKDLTILDDRGKPFFPIGTYGAPVAEYKTLKDAGYNFVVASADDLDKVQEAGLLGAIHVHGSDPQAIHKFIGKHKDHPAVLCWMLFDEPGYNKADLQYIYDIYNAAYRADKVHPSYLVITTPTVYKSFGGLCDVLAIDTYPISNGSIESVPENVALAYGQLEREVPIWHCGQMFAWPNDRRPTPQEHRFMTYSAMIHGARGTLWYTYRGYGQNLPVDGPQLWAAQKVLLKELNELAPLFCAPGFGKEIQPLQGNDSILAILKESPIGTFLMVANLSKTETFQPALEVSKQYDGKTTVYNEARTVIVENGILKDAFEPLDVHIYKLK